MKKKIKSVYPYLQRILQTEFKNSDFIMYMKKKDLLTGRFGFLCRCLCLCVIWNGGDEVGGVHYLVDEEEDLYDGHLWSMAAVNIHSWSP